MLKRVKRTLLAGLVLSGIAASYSGCAIIGTVDFDIGFKVTGGTRTLTCQEANVISVRFQFFDQALDNLLRTEVARPCVVGERYRVSIDLGPYNIKIQGLNGQQTICYESNVLHTVVGGKTEQLSLISEQHSTGAAGGCTYPPPT